VGSLDDHAACSALSIATLTAGDVVAGVCLISVAQGCWQAAGETSALRATQLPPSARPCVLRRAAAAIPRCRPWDGRPVPRAPATISCGSAIGPCRSKALQPRWPFHCARRPRCGIEADDDDCDSHYRDDQDKPVIGRQA
jgi:hypothetical protein